MIAELVSEKTRDLVPRVALERGAAVAGVAADLVIPHPTGSPVRKLVVRASADGDIDVEVHVPGRPGSPFVQHFPASGDPLFLPAVARGTAAEKASTPWPLRYRIVSMIAEAGTPRLTIASCTASNWPLVSVIVTDTLFVSRTYQAPVAASITMGSRPPSMSRIT